MASGRSEFPPFMISIMIVFTTMTIDARELRPSDHGLEYYEPEESSEMTSFFGPPELTSSSSSPSASTLPSAVMHSSKDRDDDDDDHVMSHVLVVGSLVCGLSGVALMVASALIYFLGNNPNNQLTSSSTNIPDQIRTITTK